MSYDVLKSKRVAPYLEWIRSNEVDLLNSLQSLASGYGNLVIENLEKVDMEYIRNLCNKGVDTSILMLKLFLNEISFGITFKDDLSFFPSDEYFWMLFCSENKSNYDIFAKNYIKRDEKIRYKRKNKIYDWPELFLSLSYLIVGDREQCHFHLDQALLAKKPTSQLKGYREIIKGILEINTSLIYDGLEKQLEWFNKSSQSHYSPEFPYNFPVMGFINFARYKGIEIHLDSPHVYPDMLKPLPDDFIFEGIPEVYEAIEKAKRKQRGVMGKLRDFF